jgi:hypothetical protein
MWQNCEEQDVTVTHVTQLTNKTGHCPSLLMDNFFSSPQLWMMIKNKINGYGTVRPKKWMLQTMCCKKLKQEDIKAATSRDLTATIWKDKREVYVSPNMHNPPAESNFCNEHGFCWQGTQNGDYFPMQVETFFFLLLNLTILHSYVLLPYSGKKITHREFQILVVRNMLTHASNEHCIKRPVGRQASAINKVARLASTSNQHWLVPSTYLQCQNCSTCGIRSVRAKCENWVCVEQSYICDHHTMAIIKQIMSIHSTLNVLFLFTNINWNLFCIFQGVNLV